MAHVVLFHHALGLTPGCRSLADTLEAAGHTVTTPDLYDGAVFTSLEAGIEHLEEIGFDEIVERGCEAVAGLPAGLVYAGISFGVMPAQRLALTRPGAAGAVLLEACAPVDAFADRWPNGVPVQIHGMDGDEFFAGEGDLDNAVRPGRARIPHHRRRAVHLPRRCALVRRQLHRRPRPRCHRTHRAAGARPAPPHRRPGPLSPVSTIRSGRCA